jgi:farnesol dehydrogenase
MKALTVLVTGGTGYLGAAIVRALAARGHEPIVFARRASQAGLPGRAIDGDVRDRESILRAADGVDAICHSAAMVSIWSRQPELFDQINVAGTEAVLDVARTLQTPRVVYTSSFLALPPSGARRAIEANDYQRTKVRAREIARAAAQRGIPVLVLYPGVIYGPGSASEANLVGGMLRDHFAGRLPGLIGADRIWSFAYIDDVADAHVAAIERGAPGAEYMLGGENLPQMRVFEIARERAGTKLPARLPLPIARLAAWIEETRARRSRYTPRLTRGVVEILRHDWPLDSARSVQELSYRITPLDQGLAAVMKR